MSSNRNINLSTRSTPFNFPGAAGALINSLRNDQSQSGLNSGVSESAQEAFTTPGNTKKYIRLQSKGLNNLRSEIIAISEFIPVTTGNKDEETAKITKEIGGSTLTVTNVARLIELHRQLREYTLTAADLIFKKIYPDLHTEGFLTWLKNGVFVVFDRLAAGNINDTINNVIDYFLNEDGSSTSKKEYRDIIESNKTNTFFLALIEYFIYSKLVTTIIDFAARLATIDKELGKYWEVPSFGKLKEYSPDTAFEFGSAKLNDLFDVVEETKLNDADISKSLLGYSRTPDNSATDSFMAAVGQLLNVLTFRDSASVLETLKNANDGKLEISPGTIRIGVEADLANMIAKLKNISLTGFITNLGNNTEQERTGILAGAYNPDEQLTGDNFYEIFKHTKKANGDRIESVSEGAKELLAALSYDIVSFYISRIGGVLEGVLENTSEQITQLDLGYSISDSLHKYQDNGYVRYSPETADLGTNVYFDYFEKNFGISRSLLDISDFAGNAVPINIETAGEILPSLVLPNTVSNSEGFGNFTRLTAGYRKGQFEKLNVDTNITEIQNVNYTPLENNEARARNVITSDDTSGAINGVEYFIQSKVDSIDVSENRIVGIESNELVDFSNEYKGFSNNLAEDILTLYPDNDIARFYQEEYAPSGPGSHKLTPLGRVSATNIMSSIFKGLENDLQSVIDNGVDDNSTLIPLLAVLLNDHGSNNKNMNVFLSSAWGVIGQGSDTSSSEDRSKTIGSFIEYYTERSVETFFKTLGLTPREAGSDAKRTFAGGSEVEYRLLLGDKTAGTGNLFHSEDIKGKFNGGKNVNKISDNNNKDGEIIDLIMNAKKVDNVFDKAFGGGTGNNLSKVVSGNEINSNYGMSRLFKETYKSANNRNDEITDYLKTATTTGGVVPSKLMNSFSYKYVQGGRLKSKGRSYYDQGGQGMAPTELGQATNPNTNNGELINFSGHHAHLIAYHWSRTLLKKTLQILAKTNSDGQLTLRIYADQIKGTIDGLRRARRSPLVYSDTISESYKKAYNIAHNYGEDTLQKIKVREQFIRDLSVIFSAHSDGLKFAADKVNNVLTGKNADGTLSPENELAMSVLRSNGVFGDFVTLNSEYSAGEIERAKSSLFTIKEDSTLMKSEKYLLTKTNLMQKVLSEEGYGFLQNETFGNKSIINVGITNSMLSTMQNIAFRETQDTNYLDSPYVCISVFKKDHFNPSFKFYPKNYIFDTSANILDYNDSRSGYTRPGFSDQNLSNHLKNYVETENMENLLRSLEITRYVLNDSGKLTKIVKKGYKSNSGSTGDGVASKDILINHLHDYVLKAYLKLTTGVDINENNFLLKADPVDYQKIKSTNYLGDDLIKTYEEVLGEVKKIYPRIDTDDSLRSEVFRLVSIIKQSAPFSFVNRFNQIITPNSFDKVYSIFVNEKDFVLESPVVNESSFFKSKPHFGINAKLSKPHVDERYVTPENKNYVRSLEANCPEVYNYYVKVSLLPAGFIPGADIEKTPNQSPTGVTPGGVYADKQFSSSSAKISTGYKLF